jgi:hypothetical protein
MSHVYFGGYRASSIWRWIALRLSDSNWLTTSGIDLRQSAKHDQQGRYLPGPNDVSQPDNYGYYGRPHNYPALNGFYREVRRTWLRCLRRRSQKSRRMGWPQFETLTSRFPLPVPRITRTWAQARI